MILLRNNIKQCKAWRLSQMGCKLNSNHFYSLLVNNNFIMLTPWRGGDSVWQSCSTAFGNKRVYT